MSDVKHIIWFGFQSDVGIDGNEVETFNLITNDGNPIVTNDLDNIVTQH